MGQWRGNSISWQLQQLQSDKAHEDTIEVPIVRDFERRRKERSLSRHALTLTFRKRGPRQGHCSSFPSNLIRLLSGSKIVGRSCAASPKEPTGKKNNRVTGGSEEGSK